MSLSRIINKLSFLSKLILLESFDKMAKSLSFMLQPQVSMSSEIADCLAFLRRLFVKCEIPICSAASNKYEIKKTKIESFINDELETSSSYDESDSDSDNETDNEPSNEINHESIKVYVAVTSQHVI